MKKILLDWNGVIARENDLFKNITEKSLNPNYKYESSDSWDNIRKIGTINYFSKIEKFFFDYQTIYDGAKEFINKTYSKNENSEYSNYIIYDNKPKINLTIDQIIFNLSKNLVQLGYYSNGIYVDSDKIKMAKIIGVDFIIDDDPRIVIAGAYSGIKSILMLRKWNSMFSFDNLKMTTQKDKYEKIIENAFIAEDFYECSQIIKS